MMAYHTDISKVHRISIPTPFPVGPINCYVIEGAPLTLIDVGPKTDDAMKSLKTGLESLDYQLSDIEQILITHGHIDHAGMTAHLVETMRKDCEPLVKIHERDAVRILDNEGYIHQRMNAYLEIIKRSGVPEEFYSYYNHERLVRYFSPLGSSIESVNFIKHGDEIDTGIGPLIVHHTPGHSMGSVCFLHHTSETIFSGDTLLKDISSNPSLSFDENELSLSFYLRSLESLKPYGHYQVLPGHRFSIPCAINRITELEQDFEEKYSETLGFITKEPQNIYELSRKLFGDYAVGSMVLALAETQDYVRILEKEFPSIIIEEDAGICQVYRTDV